jgi:hydrogenase nickel incorporation protein HypA/HybF
MHELSVTESILEIALRHANGTGATRINHIYLVIGQLSSIVDDSIQFYWDMIAKDTIAESAQLHFRRILTEFLCLECNRQYHPDGQGFSCPECGGERIKIIAGNEFYLEAIDIE